MTPPSPWSENVERVEEAVTLAFDPPSEAHAALAALTAQMEETEWERDEWKRKQEIAEEQAQDRYEEWGRELLTRRAAEARVEELERISEARRLARDDWKDHAEEMERERDEAVKERDDLWAAHDTVAWHEYMATLEAAEARMEELELALDEISRASSSSSEGLTQQMARAALAAPSSTQGASRRDPQDDLRAVEELQQALQTQYEVSCEAIRRGERYERALRDIQTYHETRFVEGDAGYQAALVARAALSKTPESTDLTQDAKSV